MKRARTAFAILAALPCFALADASSNEGVDRAMSALCSGTESDFERAWRASAERERRTLLNDKGGRLLFCAMSRPELWALKRAEQIGLLTPENVRKMLASPEPFENGARACAVQFALDLRQLFPSQIDEFHDGILRFAESIGGPDERRRLSARLDSGEGGAPVDLPPSSYEDVRRCELAAHVAEGGDFATMRGSTPAGLVAVREGFATTSAAASARERAIADIIAARNTVSARARAVSF